MMKRGTWHQCGDRSQKLVSELLQEGSGVGVIISPRDLARHKSVEYAEEYHEYGAQVLIDQQFYIPGFSNKKLESYGIDQYRVSISQLNQIKERDLNELANDLRTLNYDLSTDGLIAPAVIYEAGRHDIIQLNARLFNIAKMVGDDLGIPTYATVMIGNSAISSETVLNEILSCATALDSDGWYYGFEFGQERIPSSSESVLRCCTTGLTLACTGKPVLHCYAGPMSLLSMGFGATGTGIGHTQTLWHFQRKRWQSQTHQGGGGAAPPRFFSTALWGTIVYPDEVAQLPTHLRSRIDTSSPFSQPFRTNLLPWTRWSSNKHLVHAISSTIENVAGNDDPRTCCNAAKTVLQQACEIHEDITNLGLNLRDDTNIYQQNWITAINDLLTNHSDNFDYLTLLK